MTTAEESNERGIVLIGSGFITGGCGCDGGGYEFVGMGVVSSFSIVEGRVLAGKKKYVGEFIRVLVCRI